MKTLGLAQLFLAGTLFTGCVSDDDNNNEAQGQAPTVHKGQAPTVHKSGYSAHINPYNYNTITARPWSDELQACVGPDSQYNFATKTKTTYYYLHGVSFAPPKYTDFESISDEVDIIRTLGCELVAEYIETAHSRHEKSVDALKKAQHTMGCKEAGLAYNH